MMIMNKLHWAVQKEEKHGQKIMFILLFH